MSDDPHIEHMLGGRFLLLTIEDEIVRLFDAEDGTDDRSLIIETADFETVLEKAIGLSVKQGVGIQLPDGSRVHGHSRPTIAFMIRTLLGRPPVGRLN